jgi:hypothetical protein
MIATTVLHLPNNLAASVRVELPCYDGAAAALAAAEAEAGGAGAAVSVPQVGQVLCAAHQIERHVVQSQAIVLCVLWQKQCARRFTL